MSEVMMNVFFGMFEPQKLLLLITGVMTGLIIGLIPGLTGLFGLTLMVPLTYTMNLNDALIVMMAMLGVSMTGDSIPAVLLAIPGTPSATATIMDGYPLTKKGQGARALGAAYTSSAIGGLFGAVVLMALVPVARSLILIFGSPEILMLSVWGITMIATLTGGTPSRGLAAAALGLVLASIGRAPSTGELRYTMGIPYLWNGIPFAPAVLGLFAFPEIFSLALTKARISKVDLPKFRELWKGQIWGAKDSFKNIFLILRCSAIGALIGIIPGLGGSVASWLSYGHAKQTCKNSQTFGTGDIRGVIAPECSNNAVEGGALLPTLAFGVPGSAAMAILLGAFINVGVQPGKLMVTERVDIVYTLMWALALSNIIGTGICFLLSGQLALLVFSPYYVLVSILVPTVFLAAYVSTISFWDMVACLAFGILGYLMREFKWPRPPLLMGFILGPYIEWNLGLSFTLLQWSWFYRPPVLVISALTVASLIYAYVQSARKETPQ